MARPPPHLGRRRPRPGYRLPHPPVPTVLPLARIQHFGCPLTNGTIVPYSVSITGTTVPTIASSLPDDQQKPGTRGGGRNRAPGGTNDNHRDRSNRKSARGRARSPSLLGPGRDRGGPADDRARRLGRHRRPALGPEGAAHLDRQPAVGDERLHPGLRQPAPARRPDRRLPGTAPNVLLRIDRLRRRLRPRRAGPELGHALRGPRPARRLRRGHGPGRPVPPDHHLHRAPRTGPGLRRLRRDRRGRRGHRPGPGWDPHPAGVLALDAADQRAHRAVGRVCRQPVHPREPGRVTVRVRHPGRGLGHRRAVPPGLRIHHRRNQRMGGPAHRRPPARCRRHAGRSS